LKKHSAPALSEKAAANAASPKLRIDILLVERGLAPSRERAQALLMAGNVYVNGQKIDKPGAKIAAASRIELAGLPQRYASRGGLKLQGALEDFGLTPRDRVCVDIGSSTGGFTDCLLQNGAATVYAVDVTIDQLDWKLRNDSRVITIEKNARYLRPEDIAECPSLLVMDVSFISVTKVLPAVIPLAGPAGDFLILIKPQFEL
jgi:23S rRNA (cytidine1920-2'-O)/16S rRNA (cytidine1409-2'-O)-methyltransferase